MRVEIYVTLLDKKIGTYKTKGIFRLNAMQEGKVVSSKVFARDVEGSNTDMVLELIASAMGRMTKAADIVVYQEEQYVSAMFYSALHKWVKNGFKNASGEDVASKNWWVEIARLSKEHKITVVYAPKHEQMVSDRASYKKSAPKSNGYKGKSA